jgi:hypothetical protein
MSKTFSEKIDKNVDVSFSSTFFLFYRIFGCFSAMGVQKHYKKVLQKKSCRKVFTKKSTRSPKPTFSRFLFITFLGVSRQGEFKNTIKKYRKNKSDPSPFLASDPPTHYGGHRFFFIGGPLLLLLRRSYFLRRQRANPPFFCSRTPGQHLRRGRRRAASCSNTHSAQKTRPMGLMILMGSNALLARIRLSHIRAGGFWYLKGLAYKGAVHGKCSSCACARVFTWYCPQFLPMAVKPNPLTQFGIVDAEITSAVVLCVLVLSDLEHRVGRIDENAAHAPLACVRPTVQSNVSILSPLCCPTGEICRAGGS